MVQSWVSYAGAKRLISFSAMGSAGSGQPGQQNADHAMALTASRY